MFLFAIQVEHGHAPAEGLNALFQNNLINWLLLVAALIWLAMKYLPAVFQARQNSVQSALNHAWKAREEGHAFLEEQRKKVANAEKETQQLLDEAKSIAAQMKMQMEEQAEKDVEMLLHKIEGAIANERQMLVTELRTAAVKAAIEVTEEHLRSSITEASKARLLNQFISQLDTISRDEQPFARSALGVQSPGGRNA